MQKKFKILKAHFPYPSEHYAVSQWASDMEKTCVNDPKIESLTSVYLADTPVTMTRNLAVKLAIENKMDILIMIDADMGADLINPNQTFWETTFNFMLSRWNQAPSIVAVPYCSAPPVEAVMGFKWSTTQTDDPNPNYQLKKYDRDESVLLKGILPAAAVGTGLVAIDMRIFTGFTLPNGQVVKLNKKPYFYYEWADEAQTTKLSTEDVVFSRNAGLTFAEHGLDTVFINWDCWAKHYKVKEVGKPQLINNQSIANLFVKQ